MLIDAAGLRAYIGAILSETEAGGVMKMPVFGSSMAPRAPCTASKFAALSLPCAAKVSGTDETVRCGGFSKPYGSF